MHIAMRQAKMRGELPEPAPRPASAVRNWRDPQGSCFLRFSKSFSLVLIFGLFCLSTPKSAAQVIADGLTPPRVISKPEPEYVDSKHAAEFKGSVASVGLSVVVEKDGRIGAMRIVKSLGMGLDVRALNSMHNWRFEPAHKDGKPVPAEIRVEVEFKRK